LEQDPLDALYYPEEIIMRLVIMISDDLKLTPGA
jgi:hypothetical protein